MNASPQWGYVQARLQARHGERLEESDWRPLEAAHSLDHFIERARATALRRFIEISNTRMSSHAIERTMRAAWRDYVTELSAWVPPKWRPAVLWTAYALELPAVDAWRKGDGRNWMRHDPVVAELIDNSLVVKADDDGGTTAARWYTHWRSLWPRTQKTDSRHLTDLADLVSVHVALLAEAGAQETSGRYRQDLRRAVTRLFRRNPATPVAVFSHLILTALDLQRLRGGFARRRLFDRGRAGEAA